MMSSRIAVHTACAEIRRPPLSAVVSPFTSGPALSNLRLKPAKRIRLTRVQRLYSKPPGFPMGDDNSGIFFGHVDGRGGGVRRRPRPKRTGPFDSGGRWV